MKKTNKIISILLVVAMMLAMAPISVLAATEAFVLEKNYIDYEINYSDKVTQYYQDGNYLYKVTYTNLKNVKKVNVSSASGQLRLNFEALDTGNSYYSKLYKAKNDLAYTGDLPKSPGSTLSCLITNEDIASNINKPVVIFTCLDVNAPAWTWDGTSSATAKFTSTDGNAFANVTATISQQTVTEATDCTIKAQVEYKAAVTFNGQTYTNTKTVTGAAGPHSSVYSASENVVVETCSVCTNPIGTLTISAPADLYADGVTAKEAVIDNQLVEAADYTVTYSTADGNAPKTAGTYTASVTIGGATASVEFTLSNYAAKVTDEDGNLVGNYKTYEDALTAAKENNDSTLTLLDDITITTFQLIDCGKFTLDLNGKTLLNETMWVLRIQSEGNLTIKDSGEGGTVQTTDPESFAILNYGTVTVESGIIKGDSGISNTGTLTFNGGTVETVYSAISNSGTAYIYEGILKNENVNVIENQGTLYVYGGKMSGGNGCISSTGNTYISGGEFKADSFAALNHLEGTLEVTGGSFSGTDREDGVFTGKPCGEFTVCCSEGETIIFKGGEFPNGFTVYGTTANTLLAEGYAFYDANGNKITVAADAKKIDGYVQVKEHYIARVTDKDGNEIEDSPFKTLEEVADTVRWDYENATITLLDDITLDSTWSVGGVVTIDLNGKKLNCTSGDTIFVQAFDGFEVTVVDSSENKTGVIRSETGTAIDVGVGSKFILNSGTITTENYYAIKAAYRERKHSLLEVNGGTVNGVVICYADSVVTGGTFNDMFAISYSYKQNNFSGGIFNGGIKITSSDPLNNILADGYHFRNAQGKVVDGSSEIIEEKVTIEKGADFSADAVVTVEDVVYNGSAQEPDVTVTIGGKYLTEGKDYTIAFANNINAGTATVTVKAVGQVAGGIVGGGNSNVGNSVESVYTGEITKEFTILKADSSIDVYPEANELTYNGTAQKLITAGSAVNSTMVYSLDGAEYSETIPTGINAGEYTVYYKAEGDSNHNDTEPLTVNVTIKAKDISDGFIILGDALTYNGEEQTQTVAEFTIPAGLEVTYTVSGNKATNVGVYLLTVTGTGNFTGEAKIAYEIAVDASGVEGLTIENVKSSDKENVEYVYNQLENAVKDLADEDKISEWNTLQSYCAAMRQRIEIVENQIEAFENKLGEYDIDTVTSDDNDDLVNLFDSVYLFTVEYNDNLTDDEKDKCTEISAAIAELTRRIGTVGEEITRITNAVNGYDEATVKYGDYKDILQLIDDIEALTTGKNITDFERADLEELNTKANLLAAKIRSTADEISRITRAVNAYSIDTVNSSDKADIENLIARIKKLTDGDNITADERANLNELDSILDALLAKIDETADELARLESEVGKYDEATVKSSDKADLEQLKAEIKALTDGQNITADERAKLENLDATCDKLLVKIAETKSEYDRVIAAANGYDEATVTSADKDALVQLNEDIYALALTENVTAEEKENLQAAHDKVFALIDKLVGISDEIKRITEKVDAYVFESVKSSDKADIQQLIADIKALLDTQNITADERTILETADETCDKLVAKIDETVAEINRINDATNAYDEATVTSADKEAVEQLIADIKALTDGDNITDAEREQLVADDETLDALLAKINATADEIARVETAVNSYDEESVKSTDKTDLEQLKADIKTLTDTNNITEDERAKLGNLDAALDSLIKKIDDTASEIARIDEAVNSYDSDTVTSADVQDLGKLISDIKALTDGGNLTDDEKAALEANDDAIDELVEKLTEVAEEIKRVDEAVKTYDEETVKSTDKANLEQLKEDIQVLIDSTNTTENEKTALSEMLEKVNALLNKIAETEAKLEEIKGIENNYSPENVSSDDKSDIEEALAEIEAVNPDNLTEEQKAEYDEIKAGFEALLEEIEKAGTAVDAVGAELEMFDEERVTIFYEDEIEALKAKVDELLADENMGEAEKEKLNEYKAQCDSLIEIINNPAKYFSMRLFYFVWDALNWLVNHFVFIFNWIF